MQIKAVLFFIGVIFFSVTWTSQVTEKPFLRLEKPISIKLRAKTPARLAFEFINQSSLVEPEPKHIGDLNQELAARAQKKYRLYRAEPLRIKISEVATPSATVLIGAQMPTTKAQSASSTWKSGKLTFSGPLELSPEVALGPGRHLEVRWRGDHKEVKMGRAEIAWDQSNYKVELPYPGGKVIAQVRESDGKLVGEGEYLVNSLGLLSNTAAQGGKIRIGPKQVPHPQVVDFSSYSNNRPQPNRRPHRVDTIKPAQDQSRSSQQLAYATGDEFVDSYSLFNHRQAEPLPLMPISLASVMTSMLQNLTDNPELDSFYMGKVLNHSEGQSGVKIEVETRRPYQIFYLNNMFIPDSNLKLTAENGHFVVVGLPPGAYGLRAEGLGQTIGITTLIVEAGAIGFGQLVTTSQTEQKEILIFDALNGQIQPGEVMNPLIAEDWLIMTQQWLEWPVTAQHQYVVVTPQDPFYLTATYLVDSWQKQLEFPLVSKEWIRQWVTHHRVNYRAEEGTLIGFFDQTPGTIELADKESHFELHYFDSSGQLIDRPVEGGGFIIFGIPPESLQVITLTRENPFQQWTQVFYVRPEETLVLPRSELRFDP